MRICAPLLLALAVFAACPARAASAAPSGGDAAPVAEFLAVARDATPAEQQQVDAYRESLSWSLQVDFSNAAKARAVFVPVDGDPAALKSCWRSENDVLDGMLRLETLAAPPDCRAKWSTGFFQTKQWRQLYGFFEARMKITGKPGIDNAFWLTGDKLEISAAEARFPGTLRWTVHDATAPRRIKGCSFAGRALDERMNDYGVLWLPDRFIYTLNGQALCTIETRAPAVPVDIRFSTAIANFGGQTYDAADENPTGTELDVAWVHAARLKSP